MEHPGLFKIKLIVAKIEFIRFFIVMNLVGQLFGYKINEILQLNEVEAEEMTHMSLD